MVCYYTYHEVSVYGKLMELYEKYGYVVDKSVSIAYSGLNAMKEMNAVVDKMKGLTLDCIGGREVVAVRDYSKAERKLADGSVESIDSPKTNAVYYELSGGSFICIRPSGTEPKLKVYYSVKDVDKESAEIGFNDLKSAFEKLLK